MTWRLALRSLATRPVRSVVLACGFGFGIAVMAALLGVGEVVLEQARSPWLAGGGDVRVSGGSGPLPAPRFLMHGILGREPFAASVRATAPRSSTFVFLERDDGEPVPIRATGGIPSLDRRLGDPEVAGAANWTDTSEDAAWAAPSPADLLRSIDAFHPIPEAPRFDGSWAEWLYFNGRTGKTRFYLSFMFFSEDGQGRRPAAVSLQLERDGRMVEYGTSASVDAAELLRTAPEVDLGANRIRLDGARYRITLDVTRAGGSERVTGEVVFDATGAPALPPFVVHGAKGWVSGYVVPALSAGLEGALKVGRETVTLDGGTGYHDHNWGFWDEVSWRWGQVAHEDVSIVFGRILPPPDAADPRRLPAFLGVFDRGSPVGFSVNVSITEDDDPETGGPRAITIEGTGPAFRLRMDLDVESTARRNLGRRDARARTAQQFLQMRARYTVEGEVAGREVRFEAVGSAETFRGGLPR